MNKTHILENYRTQLAELVSGTEFEPPRLNPLNISPWLAMSALQKSVRRNREELALRSAATLFRDAPDRLWKRISVISFEDIGVADFETISLVVAGLSGKRWRAENGGEWSVASYLIGQMCRTIKCRSADNLAYLSELHPDYEQARLKLTYMPIPELLER